MALSTSKTISCLSLNQPLNVLLVEDHALVRESLVILLEQLGSNILIVQAEDGTSALQQFVEKGPFQLVLVDLALPGELDGLACLAQIHALAPATPIVVVSAFDDRVTLQRVQKAGAAGFIPKRFSGEVFLNSIRSILSGKQCWLSDQDTCDNAFMALQNQKNPSLVLHKIDAKKYGLTKRQITVLSLLAAGRSNKEIAEALGVQEGTVKVHLNSIFKVIGVSSRTQAVAAVNQFGIKTD